MRILLVDDEPSFRTLIRFLLADMRPDLQVVGEASDGREAIRAAAKLQPDAILLDLKMAGMSGLEALPQLRNVAPRSHIIVLSVAAEQAPLHAAKMAGADAFIDKVLDNDRFVRALDECLAAHDWHACVEKELGVNERRALLDRRMRRANPDA